MQARRVAGCSGLQPWPCGGGAVARALGSSRGIQPLLAAGRAQLSWAGLGGAGRGGAAASKEQPTASSQRLAAHARTHRRRRPRRRVAAAGVAARCTILAPHAALRTDAIGGARHTRAGERMRRAVVLRCLSYLRVFGAIPPGRVLVVCPHRPPPSRRGPHAARGSAARVSCILTRPRPGQAWPARNGMAPRPPRSRLRRRRRRPPCGTRTAPHAALTARGPTLSDGRRANERGSAASRLLPSKRRGGARQRPPPAPGTDSPSARGPLAQRGAHPHLPRAASLVRPCHGQHLGLMRPMASLMRPMASPHGLGSWCTGRYSTGPVCWVLGLPCPARHAVVGWPRLPAAPEPSRSMLHGDCGATPRRSGP